MKPNFLIIGAQKCATTSLYYWFSQHPDIFMSTPKEPMFFTKDENYNQGGKWYESLFAGSEGCKAIGEATAELTIKSLRPNAADRVYKHLPKAKLIYIVRNPVERVRSAWMWGRRVWPKMDASFSVAIKNHPQLIDGSLYWKQINVYRKLYSDDHILVLFMEDLKMNPKAILDQCFEFLNVKPFIPKDISSPQNVSTGGRYVYGFLNWLRWRKDILFLKGFIPKRMHQPIKKLFSRQAFKPEWEPNVKKYVIDQVKDDAKKFLKFYGKADDFWTFH